MFCRLARSQETMRGSFRVIPSLNVGFKCRSAVDVSIRLLRSEGTRVRFAAGPCSHVSSGGTGCNVSIGLNKVRIAAKSAATSLRRGVTLAI